MAPGCDSRLEVRTSFLGHVGEVVVVDELGLPVQPVMDGIFIDGHVETLREGTSPCPRLGLPKPVVDRSEGKRHQWLAGYIDRLKLRCKLGEVVPRSRALFWMAYLGVSSFFVGEEGCSTRKSHDLRLARSVSFLHKVLDVDVQLPLVVEESIELAECFDIIELQP